MTGGKERSNQVQWLGLLVAVGAAVYLCWLMLLPFIDVLAWAAVLVIVFYPVHHRLATRLGQPGWSAIVSSLLVILIILAPLTLITLAVVRELQGMGHGLQASVNSLLDPNSPATGPALR